MNTCDFKMIKISEMQELPEDAAIENASLNTVYEGKNYKMTIADLTYAMPFGKEIEDINGKLLTKDEMTTYTNNNFVTKAVYDSDIAGLNKKIAELTERINKLENPIV